LSIDDAHVFDESRHRARLFDRHSRSLLHSSRTSTKTTKNTPSSSRKSNSKSSKKSADNKKKRNN
jgi:hypothetical protein